MREFDVAVIGGGPGGYVAAIRAAQLGGRVALVERASLGGTCLNRGCIPTKALYYSARALHEARRAEEFGVRTGEVGFDMETAVRRKDSVVEKLVSGVAGLLKARRVEVLKGEGTLEGPSKVHVKGESPETLGARAVIVATGSEPAMIPAFNIDGVNVITSTEALGLTRVPESLLIIGGGVMGCEFATIFSSFGSRCTIVELLPEILSLEDRQAARVVLKGFKERGVSVLTGVEVEAVEVECEGRVKTTLRDGRSFITEKVLVTIGRSFNSDGLGLEEAGVEVERGMIRVNGRMETTARGVYAIGDVTGKMLLAHVASAQGLVAAANALGDRKEMDYSAVPAGIFTDPEIASVGLKEKDAKEKGIEIEVGRFPYAASGKALGMGETEGFVKIIAEKGTDRVLGCTIVGAHATDLLAEAALAIKTGLRTDDIIETIHAHPTLPEMVQEAAEDTLGMAIHKVGRKRA